MLMVGSKEIGGGYVRLMFKDNERTYKMGEALTAEKIKSFKNYKRLIDVGMIAVYPPAPPPQTIEVSDAGANPRDLFMASKERHIVHEGFGRYNVVEGRKLNEYSLTKEEAEELANDAN